MISRRDMVCRLAAATAAGVVLPHTALSNAAAQAADGNAMPAPTPPQSDRLGELLPQRQLGKSGQWVTMAGLGGQHFQRNIPDGQHQQAIETALAGGLRFFDTAADYGRDNRSERLLGETLTPKYRDVAYIMTKSSARDANRAQGDLDRSLANLKVDQIDLWQMHTLESEADVDRRFDNGVVDVFLKAKADGKVKHIGFTGHKSIHAHLHMLKRLEERGIDVDTCQMPVNVVDPHYDSFITQVIPVLQQRGIGILAMKTWVGGRLMGTLGEFGPRRTAEIGDAIIPGKMTFNQASDYVWSLPISTRIFGYNNLQHIQENIAAAKAHQGLNAEDQQAILAATQPQSGPDIEFYKRNSRQNEGGF